MLDRRGTNTTLEITPVPINRRKPDYDRVEFHLWNWQRWMNSGQFAGLAAPGRASGGIGISHAADFDQLYDQASQVVAKACDAVIGDLGKLEQKAIRCAYLGEVWESRLSESAVLVVAKEALRIELNRRGFA